MSNCGGHSLSTMITRSAFIDMLLKTIVIGKLKDRLMQSRCDEYAKWIGGYAKFECKELPDSTVEREGQAILAELARDKNAMIIALSEEGREWTTHAFADVLKQLDKKAVFIIGGPYGLAPAVKNHADIIWSLSKLTFTHELARLLLFEQLFRALNINAGGHYHND